MNAQNFARSSCNVQRKCNVRIVLQCCAATKTATQRNTALWGVACVARSGGFLLSNV